MAERTEWFADVEINNDIETWLLEQGATARASQNTEWTGSGWRLCHPDVFFSGRQIHYYSGSKLARIFFNLENKGSLLILLIKFPDAVVKHNMPIEVIA